jgi:acetyl esterase/lipase
MKFQLLVVPITDNTATLENNSTWKDCEHTPALNPEKMMYYRDHYLPSKRSWTDIEASPLLLPTEQFAGLPPAQILVGELDILRHDGEEYARKLRKSGVAADVEVMKGMPHRKSGHAQDGSVTYLLSQLSCQWMPSLMKAVARSTSCATA